MTDVNDEKPVDVADVAPEAEETPEVVVADDDSAPEQTENTDAAKEIQPEEGIADLKRRLDAEKAAREEAEKRAWLAQQQAQRHHAEAQDSNYQMVVSAISTVRERATALRGAYAEAMQSGDYDRAAQIQEAITVNTGNLSELERGRKAMEQAAENARRQPVQPVPPPRAHVVDQLAESVSARSASWLKAHRDHINDERSVRRMFRAHEDAIDEGIEPDSDGYFEFIETRMGIRRAPPPQTEATAESPLSSASAPRRAAPPPAAPVSRGGSRPNVVRLTREQADFAKTLGMSEAEYAKNLSDLKREGKM